MRIYLLMVFFFGVMISACSPSAPNTAAPDVTASIPRTAPSIIGQVTAITLPTVLVEENPGPTQESAKASVRITDITQVLHADKGVTDITELRVGQRVKVWFTGPIMESYPVQAIGGVIVIQPSSH